MQYFRLSELPTRGDPSVLAVWRGLEKDNASISVAYSYTQIGRAHV